LFFSFSTDFEQFSLLFRLTKLFNPRFYYCIRAIEKEKTAKEKEKEKERKGDEDGDDGICCLM